MLIVDDESSVLSALRRELRAPFAGKLHVEICSDPARALTLVKAPTSTRPQRAINEFAPLAAGADLPQVSPCCGRLRHIGHFGFDFAGEYTRAIPQQLLEYSFGGRVGRVRFEDSAAGVVVTVTFDSEASHSEGQQRTGWQAILDTFSRHVVAKLASE